MANKSHNRRVFLIGTARNAAAAGIVGSAWYGYLAKAKAAPLVLRPPGSMTPGAFEAACIKCGECVQACPYDALSLADWAADAPIGTPVLNPRETPCEMCTDIPCVRNCPTGALDTDMQDIRQARIGLAVVDPSSCLSMQGLRCEACHRACPLIDEALSLVYRHQDQTGVHAYFAPTVNADLCTGCGQCEHACITERPAIRVLPRDVAMGKIGDHYRLRDFATSPDAVRPDEQPPQPDSSAETPGLDYLNRGGQP